MTSPELVPEAGATKPKGKVPVYVYVVGGAVVVALAYYLYKKNQASSSSSSTSTTENCTCDDGSTPSNGTCDDGSTPDCTGGNVSYVVGGDADAAQNAAILQAIDQLQGFTGSQPLQTSPPPAPVSPPPPATKTTPPPASKSTKQTSPEPTADKAKTAVYNGIKEALIGSGYDAGGKGSVTSSSGLSYTYAGTYSGTSANDAESIQYQPGHFETVSQWKASGRSIATGTPLYSAKKTTSKSAPKTANKAVGTKSVAPLKVS